MPAMEQMWIQDESAGLKLRIMEESHCVEHGHRSYLATMDTNGESNWCSDVKEKAKELTQSCEHCILLRTGERDP